MMDCGKCKCTSADIPAAISFTMPTNEAFQTMLPSRTPRTRVEQISPRLGWWLYMLLQLSLPRLQPSLLCVCVCVWEREWNRHGISVSVFWSGARSATTPQWPNKIYFNSQNTENVQIGLIITLHCLPCVQIVSRAPAGQIGYKMEEKKWEGEKF